MSGYMMYLTDEDREALEWVRKRGGLDHVRVEWNERVPRDLYVRRRQSLLGHIAECETALGRRREIISELTHRVSDLTNENAELRKRAMPEGYEWPRYEDGPLLRYGDSYIGNDGDNHRAWQIRFDSNADVHVSRGEDGDGFDRTTWDHFDKGERVKRPAVLAADGEPLEVGQTVWHVDGRELTVIGLPKPGEYQGVKVQTGNGFVTTFDPPLLTHHRPVLDADGVPINKGDTVWSVNDGTEYEVGGIRDTLDVDGDPYKIIECSNDELHIYYVCLPPDKLTHTKPEIDSWERIEEDAKKFICEYFGHSGKRCHGCPAFDVSDSCWPVKDADLVRRCRALAERERGE